MYITLEELYEMKESYLGAIKALNSKIAVVDDLIAVVNAKKVEATTVEIEYEAVAQEEDMQDSIA